MHRTTIRLDENLLARAKRLAAATDRSLNKVIEDALRNAVDADDREKYTRRIVLPTTGGEGLQPGVDIGKYSTLLDLMDVDEESHWR